MDEPKKAQDATTSENTEETSEKEPETFTREQVEERERKAKSDALADVGRLKTSADNAIKAAQAAEVRVNQMLKDQEDAELEDARDDAEKLSAIRERQAKRRAESELAQAKQELSEKDEQIKQYGDKEAESTKELNAREIATRLNVDANRLAKLAKFTDGSPEAIEEIAKELPKRGEAKETLKPDSGKTTGGSGGIPTNIETFRKWIADMSQEEYEKRAPEINKMMKEGKIK